MVARGPRTSEDKAKAISEEGHALRLAAMNRRSFPTGQASTALLKGLLRSLCAEKGASAGDGWLRSIGMQRDDLDDETRQLPLATVHNALAAFVELTSREAIPRCSKYLIAPDNLGVWVRMLRGTTEPAEAFARLDAVDSQYGRTTRWESIRSRRGWWRGRVTIAHDPELEQDGLLRLARLAELAAVPALFGYSDAKARATGDPSPRAGIVQDYEVTWAVPNVALESALGAALGAGIGITSLLAYAWGVSAIVGGAAAIAGGLAGALKASDRLRRADGYAQQTRVHALERSLSLKEAHEHGAGGLEGSVVAGQYRVVRRMGSGATGVIYEAARTSDGMPVAIKLLRAAAAHEAVASDRLRREAEALGLSWHPNVVEVIDHGHLPDGTAYLVMELLHGESLAGRVRAKGRLTPAELLPIAVDVCDALVAVHAAGVVHRDLKPSNIFLARARAEDASGSERVKLLDFGIARVEWEETRITNTGGPLGTPGYMSPEQESGSGEVDARSDLFAFGALLFECLVGEPPPPQTPSGLVRMDESSGARLDSGTQKAATFVPPAWRTVIDKAMALHPRDRYQDARSLALALRGLQGSAAKVEASS
jgi:Protein kinase domain